MKNRIKELVLYLLSAAVIVRVITLFILLSQYAVLARVETYNMFNYVK